jgi:regulatory protein
MPRIIKIEHMKTERRYEVVFDDQTAVSIISSVFRSLALRVGDQVEHDDIDDDIRQAALKAAYAQIGRLLSIRPRSTSEIRAALAQRGYDDNIIERAIEKTSELGIINDVDFGKEWAKSRIRTSSAGSIKIKMELSRKGLSSTAIDESLQSIAETDEFAAAIRLLRKKNATADNAPETVHRLYAMLVRRGFSGEVIRKALKTVGGSGEDLEIE